MTKKEIFNLLIEEISKKTSSEVTNPKNHPDPHNILFDKLDLNSLDILLLTMDIEKKLSIDLDITECPYHASLDEFADYLYRLKNR